MSSPSTGSVLTIKKTECMYKGIGRVCIWSIGIAGNGCGYEHLDTHRVWGRALKLLPTRVRTRVRVIFKNAGMRMGIVVPYPLGNHCHP
ncbi:hypothetical protein MTR_5g020830 [Medicago truncatula]|uniref:Uncharacterized protein n=1 Tax=Medicago truncatula TaxID=3880 RepID=G7KEZ4_MEDTR|nr:hypothetical protein MTR_5g020830 [Medicago truncatula]